MDNVNLEGYESNVDLAKYESVARGLYHDALRKVKKKSKRIGLPVDLQEFLIGDIARSLAANVISEHQNGVNCHGASNDGKGKRQLCQRCEELGVRKV